MNQKAIGCFRKSLEIRNILFGDKHDSIADCYYNIGLGYKKKGNIDKVSFLYYLFKKFSIFVRQFLI